MVYMLNTRVYPPDSYLQLAYDEILSSISDRHGIQIYTFDKDFVLERFVEEELVDTRSEASDLFGELVRYGYVLRVSPSPIVEGRHN